MKIGAIALLLSMTFVGCSSLTPYEEIAASLPVGRLVEFEGQRIHVETHGAGPPLLMLHGFASSTYSFRRIIPRLAERRRVIAIDLNGFGFTERPGDVEAYKASAQIRTILGVLDSLGVHRCDVVGHSYGGALAILLAKEDPSRVRRLALISPYTEFGDTPVILRSKVGRDLTYGGTRVLLGNRMISRAGVRRAFHLDHLVTPEVAEEYRRRILIEGFRESFEGYSLIMEESGPMQIPLGQIEQPTLIVTGVHDKLVSVESCRRTSAAIPNATLRILEECGHSAAEEHPKEVLEMILNFLGSW